MCICDLFACAGDLGLYFHPKDFLSVATVKQSIPKMRTFLFCFVFGGFSLLSKCFFFSLIIHFELLLFLPINGRRKTNKQTNKNKPTKKHKKSEEKQPKREGKNKKKC